MRLIIVALVVLLGSGMFAGLAYDNMVQAVQAGPPEVVQPLGGGNGVVKMKRNIAVKLCIAMARSGAYTDLDDNQFSDLCIKVASHLGDSQYDHTD